MKIVRIENQTPYYHYNIVDDNGEILATDNYFLKYKYPMISIQIVDMLFNDEIDENFIDSFTGEQLIVYKCIKDLDLYWSTGYLYIPMSHNGYISGIERRLPIFNYGNFVTTNSIQALCFEKF